MRPLLPSLLCGLLFVTAALSVPASAGGAMNAVISSPGNYALYDAGQKVNFDGSKSVNGCGQYNQSWYNFVWDFGDATTDTVNIKPGHTYTRAGEYKVTLTVKDPNRQCVDSTASVFVDIAPASAAPPPVPVGGGGIVGGGIAVGGFKLFAPVQGGPQAVISSPANYALYDAGQKVNFDGSKSTASGQYNGTVLTFKWDFGDGTILDRAPNKVEHPYVKAGEYKVTLTVSDWGGSSTATVTVDISPASQSAPPVPAGGIGVVGGGIAVGGLRLFAPQQGGVQAVIGSPVNNALADAGKDIVFDGMSSTLGRATTITWDFGDSSGAYGNLKANHTYRTAGMYTVTLTLKEDLGWGKFVESSATVMVYISPPGQTPPPLPAGGVSIGGIRSMVALL